jgi:hypothetical protein
MLFRLNLEWILLRSSAFNQRVSQPFTQHFSSVVGFRRGDPTLAAALPSAVAMRTLHFDRPLSATEKNSGTSKMILVRFGRPFPTKKKMEKPNVGGDGFKLP